MENMEHKAWMRVREYSAYSGLSDTTIRAKVNHGSLHGEKIDGVLMIRVADEALDPNKCAKDCHLFSRPQTDGCIGLTIMDCGMDEEGNAKCAFYKRKGF